RTIAVKKTRSERETCDGLSTCSAYAVEPPVQVLGPRRVLSDVARCAEVTDVAARPRRQLVLRAVNARIREISDRFGTADGTYRLLCECGREDCDERVEVEVALYDEARRSRDFFLAPGHAVPGLEAMPGLLA